MPGNKPERVFGLQVRCRKLDIFKISRNCLELFWIFEGIVLVRIFWEEFLGRIFLGEIFEMIVLGGRNFGVRNLLGGIFWEELFGRNFLGGILCLHC